MNHPLSPKPAPFHTHITFASGEGHMETTDEDKLVSTITRLLRGPAAMMGIIKEVKIVDQMDCIVFLARDNNVVFPKPNNSQK